MPYYQKYRKYQEQVSYDQGVTWEYVYPAHYATSGDPLERYDTLEECEMKKFILTLNDSSIASGDCDSTSAITSEEVSTQYSGTVVSAQIGSCVNTIGNDAFRECYYLQNIAIPNSVTNIGDRAFSHCVSLSSITIPDTVTSIGNQAFDTCDRATGIAIGNGVTTIGYGAFLACRSATTLTIGNNVTTIGDYAFYNCEALTSITIPNSVITIGEDAFNACLYATSLTIGSGVTNIGDDAFANTGRLQSITIYATTPPTIASEYEFYDSNCPIYVPCDSVDAYKTASGWSEYSDRIQCKVEGKVKLNLNNSSSVTISCDTTSAITSGEVATRYSGTTKTAYVGDCAKTISSNTFYGCSKLEEVILPNTIKDIGHSAFYGCTSLSSITIPNSVTNIDDYAFYNCKINSNVVIPSGVTSTHNYTFMYSSLTGVDFPNTLTFIGVSAFAGCSNLKNITIPSSTTIVGNSAFGNCDSLSSVTISNGVQALGNAIFKSCDALSSIAIPDSVGYLGESAFTYCSNLTSVNLPNGNSGFTALNDKTFLGCKSLTSITIPNSITSIGDVVFDGCSGLTSVVIGNGVTSIGYSAFRNCKNLTGITINAIIPPTLDSNVFYGTNNCPIYVPCESVNAYKTAWSAYESRIQCVSPPSYSGQYLTFVAQESGTFTFTKRASTGDIQYKKNDGVWATGSAVTVVNGDIVMWKGKMTPTTTYPQGIGKFSSTGRFVANGTPMSLLFGDNFSGLTSLSGRDYAFNGLFYDCSGLTSAENLVLPATTLASGCYYGMFNYCTSLTTAPNLPATTLAQFCYSYMFNGCTSLTTAPNLPATTLAQYCYSYMLNGCTSLSSITCLARYISAYNCTEYWTNGVSANGTFVKNASMTSWTTGVNGIPSGWTVVDYS